MVWCIIVDMHIQPYADNAKKHPKSQIEQIAKSIERFGMNQPIVIDSKGIIIVGHGRYLALQHLGWEIKDEYIKQVDNLTPQEVNAYRLADNKLNESDWEMDLVIEELRSLDDPALQLLTGFDMDLLLEPEEADDAVPDVPEEPRSKLGDLYQLGNHRVLCGDSTKLEDVERLTEGKKADMVFTDPPYGMNYSGRGSNTSNKILGDDIDPTQFYNVGLEIPERYIWGRIENYKHLTEEPRDTIIWKKNSFGMGRGYRGQYECCFYYGAFSGSDSDVWEIPKDSNYQHPTQKPVELCVRAIKNSQPNLIIDYFLGSGSTLIAAQKTGRHCYGLELDPKYVDVIVQRYVDYVDNPVVILDGKDVTNLWTKTPKTSPTQD